MRKKIMSIAFVVAIAVAAAWNFSRSSKVEVGLSDLALANVEALAGEEDSGAGKSSCYNCNFNAYTICWETAYDGCFGTYSGPVDV
jgi:hypothetical protein